MTYTPRQWEVLKLVLCGCTAKEIAKELGISTRTVEWHCANIRAAAGVNRTRRANER